MAWITWARSLVRLVLATWPVKSVMALPVMSVTALSVTALYVTALYVTACAILHMASSSPPVIPESG